MKLIFTFILAFPFLAMAQTPPMMPGAENSGMLEGIVVDKDSGKPIPVANQEVGLVVFQNGEPVLNLHKATDAEGKFTFKNILKDPSFEFAIGVMREGQAYVLSGLKLKEGEELLKVELVIGAKSPYRVSEEMMKEANQPAAPDMGMPPPSATQTSPMNPQAKGNPLTYQRVAIILSLFVVALFIYHFFFVRPREANRHAKRD